MQLRLREEARALFLQKKNKELLSNEELDVRIFNHLEVELQWLDFCFENFFFELYTWVSFVLTVQRIWKTYWNKTSRHLQMKILWSIM